MSEPVYSSLNDRATIKYTDMDTGQPFDLETFIEDARVGETATKRVQFTNTNPAYSIRLINPQAEGLRIVRYSSEFIKPGGNGEIELAFDVPKEAIIPPLGTWAFDIAVRQVE